METLELLRLIVARDARDGGAIARWDAAAWERVQAVITAWDAQPIAFGALRAARLLERVPPGVAAAWRKDHAATTAVNLELAFEVEALLAALSRAGVAAAPLKGTALFLAGAWRDPGSRPTCDIDLLIAKEDGAAALRALEARGYESTRAGGPKHWPPLVRGQLVVEVHEHAFWSLRDGHRVGLGEMLDVRGRAPRPGAGAHHVHPQLERRAARSWRAWPTRRSGSGWGGGSARSQGCSRPPSIGRRRRRGRASSEPGTSRRCCAGALQEYGRWTRPCGCRIGPRRSRGCPWPRRLRSCGTTSCHPPSRCGRSSGSGRDRRGCGRCTRCGRRSSRPGARSTRRGS
jgi:hypothetical protein